MPGKGARMPWLHKALAFLRHLTNPQDLNTMAASLDGWLYGVLFAIIFCETGLVVLPFLPGDSLLFAVGALGALPDSPIHLPLIAGLLVVAAVAGDAVNYAIGARIGPAVFKGEGHRWLNRKHLEAAHAFYEKHGSRRSSWRASSPSCAPSRPSWRAWRAWATPTSPSTTWWGACCGWACSWAPAASSAASPG